MRPSRDRRMPALETPKPPRVAPPQPARQPPFQFPLFMLLIMTTVIAMALAPASYFFRAAANDRGSRSVAMILMLVGPLLTVVFLSAAYQAAKYFRNR